MLKWHQYIIDTCTFVKRAFCIKTYLRGGDIRGEGHNRSLVFFILFSFYHIQCYPYLNIISTVKTKGIINNNKHKKVDRKEKQGT